MGLSRKIAFQPATGVAIDDRAARFGGQPAWVEDPQWPLSRSTGKPMQFIGQVPLAPPLFTGRGGAMAYVFMTDDAGGLETWEPDGGENAVVVQPGRYAGPAAARATGPTLYAMVERPGHDLLQAEPAVFDVVATDTTEPALASEDARSDWSDEQQEAYAEALVGSKIGGAPLFLQFDEYPEGQDEHGWKLLLQLDSADAPFYVNFGDAGVAYVFVDAAETEGRMLWQCG